MTLPPFDPRHLPPRIQVDSYKLDMFVTDEEGRQPYRPIVDVWLDIDNRLVIHAELRESPNEGGQHACTEDPKEL